MTRRSILVVSGLTIGSALAATSVILETAAHAHGFVSDPPSRQAQCAAGTVAGCGDIVYEPQSVEAPKGSMQCNGGGARFAVLNDDSKNWRATPVGNSVTFNWNFTARHASRDYEYFIGGERIGFFAAGGQQPTGVVSHTVDVSKFNGRQKVLARWNIGDTVMSFYACVDLQIGGGGNTPPSAESTPSGTTTPSAGSMPSGTTTPPTGGQPSTAPSTSASPVAPSPGGGDTSATWTAGRPYAVGQTVTFDGQAYRCVQAHTSQPGWQPPQAPVLWQRAG